MSDFILDEDLFDIIVEPQEFFVERGGPGSGHHKHEGRPGEVGGSLPGDGWLAEARAYADRLRNPAKKKYAKEFINVLYFNEQGFYPPHPAPDQVFRKGRYRPPDHEFVKIFRELSDMAPAPKDEPDFDELYPVAGDEVGDREIRLPVPNTDSISASFMDYEILDGIREVKMADIFSEGEMPYYYSVDKRESTRELVEALKTSDWIEPLIVGVEMAGPHVLEGSHRIDALRELGEETFPAMIVIDRESLVERGGKRTERSLLLRIYDLLIRREGPVIDTAYLKDMLKPRVFRGGEGSGHFEHEGRPGEVGGSLPSGEIDGEDEYRPKEDDFATWGDNDALVWINSDNEDGTFDIEVISGPDRGAYYDNIPADDMWESDLDEIHLWIDEGPDASINRAIASFGLTEDANEAGFILHDGTMLDFSGSNIGGSYGRRALDHRDIGRILLDKEPGGTEGMVFFMDQTNSIRMMFSSGDLNIDFAQMPTRAQREAVEYLGMQAETIYWDMTYFNSETNKFWRAGSGSIDSPNVDDIQQLFRDLKTAEMSARSLTVRVIGILRRIIKRGGPGSGHHGHRGRPGEVGGSLPSGGLTDEEMHGEMYEGRPTITLHKNAFGAKLRFLGVNPDIAKQDENLIVPTQKQIEYVATMIFNTVPDDIKKLWRGGTSDTVIIAIHPDEFYGLHQANWIVLGQFAINPKYRSETIEHEFIHHILQQDFMLMPINDSYHTDDMFSHADRRPQGIWSKKGEDLTMMLTSYDSDREKWIDNLMDIPPLMRDSKYHDETGELSRGLDRTRAGAKIDEVLRFMRTYRYLPKESKQS